MKKISQYFKKGMLIFLKIIIAILMWLRTSFGHKSIDPEHKDNKSIDSDK